MEKEIIFQSDLEKLIGKRPFAQQTTYEAYTNGKNQEKLDKEKKEEEEKKKKESLAKEEITTADTSNSDSTDKEDKKED